MEITRKSELTGKVNTMDLPVDNARLWKYMNGGGHIQNIFPELSAEHREFIRSGITPEEWKLYFGE